MYTHVTEIQVRPEHVDEVMCDVREYVAIARKLRGYRGYVTLIDESTGEGTVVTWWETEANALAGIDGTTQVPSIGATRGRPADLVAAA